jgi:hypothetical protein
VDAELSFDWCAHMTGKGVIDNVTITVEIVEGPGTLADNGTQVSAELSTTQEKGKLEWQHAKVKLVGVTDDTRIQIHPTHYKDGAGASQQRWHLDNIKVAEPEPAKPAVGDVLWEEWWQGGAAGDTPSAYQEKETCSTVVFGEGNVVYSQNSASTKLYDDALVFYNSKDNVTDEKYRYNLLVTKGNGFLDVNGIPCNGVKTATLTYRSNSKLEGNHQVTSTTAGVTIGELSATSVPKQDLADKNTYTVTCTVTIPEGTKTLDLCITNINAKSNIRVDGLQVVVTEVQ